MRGYNVLSLFGGIETGYAALKDAGVPIENYWSSEIDKCAIKVTSIKYPQVKHLGDVVKFARYFCASPKNIEKIKQYQYVTAKTLRIISQLEEIKANGVDLCIGGSPCQGFSFAGKQLNFKDPRSALFFTYIQILNECKRLNPNVYFVLENVPMVKKSERVINETLGLHPWRNNAALVCAQNRNRLWWSNIRTKEVGLFGEVHTDFPQPEDKGVMLADILEKEVDIKYLVSQTALARFERSEYSKPKIEPEKTGAILTKNNSGQLSVDSGTTLVGVVNGNGILRQVEKSNCIDANFAKGMDNHGQRTLAVIRLHQQDRINCMNGKARSVPAGTHGNAQHHTVTEVCGTALRRQVKNGTIQPRAAEYRNDGKSNCVTQFQELSCVSEGPMLRRLTPVEVCRLFTIPDDLFKDENGNNIVAESNQYRLLGNGWVMKAVSHIFSFLPELK